MRSGGSEGITFLPPCLRFRSLRTSVFLCSSTQNTFLPFIPLLG